MAGRNPRQRGEHEQVRDRESWKVLGAFSATRASPVRQATVEEGVVEGCCACQGAQTF